ncbi:uncharacterized protein METZ01_LOCUS273743, partial [marine metagenome]
YWTVSSCKSGNSPRPQRTASRSSNCSIFRLSITQYTRYMKATPPSKWAIRASTPRLPDSRRRKLSAHGMCARPGISITPSCSGIARD